MTKHNTLLNKLIGLTVSIEREREKKRIFFPYFIRFNFEQNVAFQPTIWYECNKILGTYATVSIQNHNNNYLSVYKVCVAQGERDRILIDSKVLFLPYGRYKNNSDMETHGKKKNISNMKN